MEYSKTINFTSEIKILSEEFSSSIKQKAIVSINDLLHGVCSRLIDVCHKKLGPKDAEGKLTVVLVEGAVKETFSGEIEKHALAEAKKTLFSFKSGLLQYNEKKLASISEKKKSKSKFPGSQFSKGISSLTAERCPDSAFASKANKLICEALGMLSTKAMSDISSKVSSENKKELTVDDIIAVTKDLIPGEMQQHAIAEGAKQVALIGSEDILQQVKKQPRRTKTVRKRAVRGKPRSRKPSRVSKKRKRSVSKRSKSPAARKRKKVLTAKEEKAAESDEILHPAKKRTRRSKTAPERAGRRKPRSSKLPGGRRKRKRIEEGKSPESDEILHPEKRRTRRSKTAPKSSIRRKPKSSKSPGGRRKRKRTKEGKSPESDEILQPAKKRTRRSKTAPKKTGRQKLRSSKSPKRKRKTPVTKKGKRESPKAKKRGVRTSKQKRSAREQQKAEKDEEEKSMAKEKKTAAATVSPINLKKAIVGLTKNFNQNFSTGAVKEIEVCLNSLLVCVVYETKDCSTIGKEEISQCLMKILPEEIRKLAFARSSQAFIDMQYHKNYT